MLLLLVGCTKEQELDLSTVENPYHAIMEFENDLFLPLWSEFSFSLSSKTVTAGFINPSLNEGKYLMSFEVVVIYVEGEGSHVVCSTGLLQPGEYKLSVPLDIGEYNLDTGKALVRVHYYDIETEELIDTYNEMTDLTVRA